jgi:hypothetical protein
MKTYKSLIAASLALAIVLVPTVGLAKEKNRDDKNCFRAYGHLIAPGWLKKNKAEVTLDADCKLPFGIHKKLHGNWNHGGGTTTDTIAPVIRDINVDPSDEEAVVTWTTNENADSKVFYGTSSTLTVDSAGVMTVSDSDRERNHRLVLQDLEEDTTYYLIVRSRDASGNVATSSRISFTTDESDEDIIAPIISDIFAVIGNTYARITWHTDEDATSKVYYSTSSPVNVDSNTTLSVESGGMTTDHSILLNNLLEDTQYHVRVESKDDDGNRKVSGEYTFTTDEE